MTTDELIATACPTLGALGSTFYFARPTLGVGKELGLDGMRWYILGRAGVLGDADSAVVRSAFGWWNGPLIAKMWDSAREIMAPRAAGTRYHECAAEFGRDKFAAVAGLDAFNEAAAAVVAAADPAGLALFAGIAAEPLADDAPGRAMQLAAVLREFRGSAHIVAVVASGLSPEKAHFIRRPDMYKSFGYDEATPPAVTDDDRAQLDVAERITDAIVRPAYSVLDAAGSAALIAGANAMQAALA